MNIFQLYNLLTSTNIVLSVYFKDSNRVEDYKNVD